MAVSNLLISVTGCSSIISCDFRDGMGQGPAICEVVCAVHTLEIGDLVTVEFGYVGDSNVMITDGTVRKIITREPDHNYTITIQDKLGQAIDFMIAPDNPTQPYQAINIEASALVVVLLGMASITGVDTDTTIFTYGTANPVDIKLVTVWQMVETICRFTGFDCRCDGAGTVHFKDRPAYIREGDTVSTHLFQAGASGDIITIEYDRNAEQLRNRIVVYGGIGQGVFYTTSAVSPYLPAGFYKTLVVAHPLIDNMPAASGTGDLNLETFNRLTETVSLQCIGNSDLRARAIVTVTEGWTGLSAAFFIIFSAHHVLNESGFVSEYTLVR